MMQNLNNIPPEDCTFDKPSTNAKKANVIRCEGGCSEGRSTHVLNQRDPETHANSTLVTKTKTSIDETEKCDSVDCMWQVNNNNNNIMPEFNKKNESAAFVIVEENDKKYWEKCESCEAVGGGGNDGNILLFDNTKQQTPKQKNKKQDKFVKESMTAMLDVMTQHEATQIEDEGGGGGGGGRVGIGMGMGRCGILASHMCDPLPIESKDGVALENPDFEECYNEFIEEYQKLHCADIRNNAAINLECEGAAAIVDDDALSPSFFKTDLNSSMRAFHSNRTSHNNSTDNLSYSSDNYFPEELMFLDEPDNDGVRSAEIDAEADDGSLNSDDCVYAYRGEGAEIDLILNRCDARDGGFSGPLDDETDFLEMDFEPDPSSEADLAHYGVNCDDLDRFSDINNRETATNLEHFLKQRDSGHVTGGRHSASNSASNSYNLSSRRNAYCPSEEQQRPQRHFSSPTGDLSVLANNCALQAQSLLSKNIARISLHLDKIRCSPEANFNEDTNFDLPRLASSSGNSQLSERNERNSDSTAHSLPNTLHPNFGQNAKTDEEFQRRASPSKVTGAKPKRLSTTFSASSSNSSKNSSKSRTSLRSVVAPSAFFDSAGFDERSASCTEFRSEPSLDDTIIAGCGLIGPLNNVLDNTEDTCLDCLEKEFLANTIGKKQDSNISHYPKCRKHSNNSSDFKSYTRFQQARCRSGSPTLFNEMPIDYFNLAMTIGSTANNAGTTGTSGNITNSTSISETTDRINNESELEIKLNDFKRNFEEHIGVAAIAASTAVPIDSANSKQYIDAVISDHNLMKTNENLLRHHVESNCKNSANKRNVNAIRMSDFAGICDKSQISINCDSINNLEFSNNLRANKLCVTIPVKNLREEELIQALDKLNVPYNLELIKAYFANPNNNHKIQESDTHTPMPASKSAVSCGSVHIFESLRHFILHESKKNCNYPKIKRLIEAATQNQLNITFEEKIDVIKPEVVSVPVSDILQQFKLNNDLKVLQNMGTRFTDMNIMGKIANIVRQAQTAHNLLRRNSNECLLIPQYYPSGQLKLSSKY